MGKQTRYSRILTITPTISTSPYTAGDQLGDVITLNALLNEVGRSTLQDIAVIDKSNTGALIDFFFFDDTPTLVSSDNDPAEISDDELATKFLKIVAIGGYRGLVGNCVATVSNVTIILQGSDLRSRSRDIFCLPVIRSAATYGSTSDLIFKFGFYQDG